MKGENRIQKGLERRKGRAKRRIERRTEMKGGEGKRKECR